MAWHAVGGPSALDRPRRALSPAPQPRPNVADWLPNKDLAAPGPANEHTVDLIAAVFRAVDEPAA